MLRTAPVLAAAIAPVLYHLEWEEVRKTTNEFGVFHYIVEQSADLRTWSRLGVSDTNRYALGELTNRSGFWRLKMGFK